MSVALDPTGAEEVPESLTTRLLDAAAAVFAERGYDGAGVAEIARRAGVTTGAIYSRYRGKAELLVDALENRTNDELDELFTDHRFDGRAADILGIAGAHLVTRTPEERDQGALLTEAFVASRRDPDVGHLLRREVARRQDQLREIIEAAKSSGSISEELDTESLVIFCHALGFGFLMIEAAALPLPQPDKWAALIGHLLDALNASGTNAFDPSSLSSDPTPSAS